MEKIISISAEETISIRQSVLRLGKPIESCRFEGDLLGTTVHFGCFQDEEIVGVLSVFENKSPLFVQRRQFQLRGMAVLPYYQGRGLGKKLLRMAESYIAKQTGEIIWFNARSNAVGFYRVCGYTVVGNPFELAGIGEHYVMCKNL